MIQGAECLYLNRHNSSLQKKQIHMRRHTVQFIDMKHKLQSSTSSIWRWLLHEQTNQQK